MTKVTKAKPFTALCLANGCTFLKAGLGKREAEREATGHLQAFGHNVSVVDMTPKGEPR